MLNSVIDEVIVRGVTICKVLRYTDSIRYFTREEFYSPKTFFFFPSPKTDNRG